MERYRENKLFRHEKSFRYVLDPLCIAALMAYALNRWFLHPHFLRGWFNDFLLIPAAMPPFLWIERQIGLRRHDRPPDANEIAFLVVVWSIACEGIAPLFITRATRDWKDVAAYLTGALLAWLFWRRSGSISFKKKEPDSPQAKAPEVS